MAEHQTAGDYTSLTYFGACSPKFPPTAADDKLKTVDLLEASKQLLPFFEKLGTAFGMISKDVRGNIDKVYKYYQTDPEKYTYVSSIISEDADKKGMSEGCVGVLWLKRGLEFDLALFKELLADHANGVTDESLAPALMRAYDRSLKQYHGWITQKVFAGVSKMAPYRSDIIKKLSLSDAATSDMVLNDIKLYNMNLSDTLQLLNKMLTECNRNPEDKV